MIIGISGYIGSGKDTVAKIIQYLTHCKNDNTTWEEWTSLKHTNMCDWQIKKYAAKLKQIASILTGIPVEKFEDQEFKKTFLGEEWNTYTSKTTGTGSWVGINTKMTVRELLQKLGTEAMRDGLHTNVWVNALFADYDVKCPTPGWCDCSATFDHNDNIDESRVENYAGDYCKNKGYPKWIISDLRFPNEFDAIKERGGICVRINRDYVLAGRDEDPKKLHPSETSLDRHEFDYTIQNDGSIEELIIEVEKMLKHFNII